MSFNVGRVILLVDRHLNGGKFTVNRGAFRLQSLFDCQSGCPDTCNMEIIQVIIAQWRLKSFILVIIRY